VLENEVVTFGIIAIVGSLGVAIGDVFLLGNPVSGRQFRAQKLENLVHVSPKNRLIGHVVGVLMVPFAMFGVFQVYRGLQPAGQFYALAPTLIMVYSLVMGASGHACFAFLGGAFQLQKQFGDDTNADVDELVKQHRRLLNPIFGAFLVSLIVASIWFSIVIWTQPTQFPMWIGFTNPFVLLVILGVAENFLPAPVGGYVRPANGNISLALFFVLTTITLS